MRAGWGGVRPRRGSRGDSDCAAPLAPLCSASPLLSLSRLSLSRPTRCPAHSSRTQTTARSASLIGLIVSTSFLPVRSSPLERLLSTDPALELAPLGRPATTSTSITKTLTASPPFLSLLPDGRPSLLSRGKAAPFPESPSRPPRRRQVLLLLALTLAAATLIDMRSSLTNATGG